MHTCMMHTYTREKCAGRANIITPTVYTKRRASHCVTMRRSEILYIWGWRERDSMLSLSLSLSLGTCVIHAALCTSEELTRVLKWFSLPWCLSPPPTPEYTEKKGKWKSLCRAVIVREQMPPAAAATQGLRARSRLFLAPFCLTSLYSHCCCRCSASERLLAQLFLVLRIVATWLIVALRCVCVVSLYVAFSRLYNFFYKVGVVAVFAVELERYHCCWCAYLQLKS